MGNIGKAIEPYTYQQPVITNTSDWHLFDSPLYCLYRFMYRQHVYDLEKRRGDCLMKWLIMLGFMDLRGGQGLSAFNAGLVKHVISLCTGLPKYHQKYTEIIYCYKRDHALFKCPTVAVWEKRIFKPNLTLNWIDTWPARGITDLPRSAG